MPGSLTVPLDVSYSIISTNTVPGVKRSLVVRLDKKVSEGTLRSLALELKSQDSRHYDRIFITYYLPGMAVGAGAWATTHFNPDLDLRILGLTSKEEELLVAKPISANRKLLGRWLDESPYSGGSITIFREGEKLYIERNFKDGSIFKAKLVEKKSSSGRRFNMAEGSRFGDHWILDFDGNLQIRDDDGLLAPARLSKAIANIGPEVDVKSLSQHFAGALVLTASSTARAG